MRGLNRDVIKYIAMVTMFLNHIANIFLEPGTLLFTILHTVKEKLRRASGFVRADIRDSVLPCLL